MKKYMFMMFMLCFFVWAVVVDNAVLSGTDRLPQDNGTYTRYKVNRWNSKILDGRYKILRDQLLVYAIVDNREQLYYIDYKTYFENTLKNLPEGSSVQLRYKRGFPKIWKRHVYEIRSGGLPVMGYSGAVLIERQKEIWKFTGIMGGIYLVLVALGFVGKPRKR